MDFPVLWFGIIAFFFVGYFILDGFDFGVGMSLPFLGKDDVDRRVLINTIGPVWDMNETWVIVGGAALFASFPEWYATLFSGFYLALLVILLALIVRGVSFEYRHQGKGEKWKRSFDWMIVIGSALPALLWGVAFSNIIQGVALDKAHNYTGSFFDLLNGYSLLGGLVTLTLFFYHGVVFVQMKTEGDLKERARKLSIKAGLVCAVLAVIYLLWTLIAHFSAATLIFTLLAAVALVGSILFAILRREKPAFFLGCATVAFAVIDLFSALFPNVMPSTTPGNSLTIWNASSGTYTLTVMSWVAVIFLPLVLAYQAWTYWVFRKRVTRAQIEGSFLESKKNGASHVQTTQPAN